MDSFLFYESWLKPTESMTNEERLEYYDAIVSYALFGVMPDTNNPFLRGVLMMVQTDIDYNVVKRDAFREKQRQNARKGGAPKGNQNARKTTQTTQTTQTTLNGNGNVNGNGNGNGNNIYITEPRKVFVKPTTKEVGEYINQYATQKGKPVTFSAEQWVSHYESNGWMVGRTKMKDWKAAVRTWFTTKYNDNGTNRNDNRQGNESAIEIIHRLIKEG